jgi:hypothetical protein
MRTLVMGHLYNVGRPFQQGTLVTLGTLPSHMGRNPTLFTRTLYRRTKSYRGTTHLSPEYPNQIQIQSGNGKPAIH